MDRKSITANYQLELESFRNSSKPFGRLEESEEFPKVVFQNIKKLYFKKVEQKHRSDKNKKEKKDSKRYKYK